MQRFKVWLRLSAHSAALLLLIAMGSMSHVTAVGTEDEFQEAEAFCSKLAGIKDDITRGLASARSDQQSSWQSQTERISVMNQQLRLDLSNLQNEIDSNHKKNIATIRLAYSSAEDLTAVDNYAASVKVIAEDRRQSVDQAQATFETVVAEMIKTRQSVRAGQTEAFRIAVEDSLHEAEVSCRDNSESVDIKPNLEKQLSTAREVYAQSTQTDESATGQLVAASNRRNEAIVSANQKAEELIMNRVDSFKLQMNLSK